MAIQQVAVKAIATPLLIGGASLAGRRWGHHIGGWLVAFPLTSGPVAFFLATDQGTDFAAQAAVGMLAGTISQVAFALAYTSSRAVAGSRPSAPVAQRSPSPPSHWPPSHGRRCPRSRL